MFDRDDWLALTQEEIIDPDRDIVDPHHHLWAWQSMSPYLLEELWADTSSGHAVSQTVYMECGWAYHKDGPDHLKVVGETAFVADVAKEASGSPEKAQIAGIISHADLRSPDLSETLDAHEQAGKGLFRGIRQAGARDFDDALTIPGRAPENLYADEAFLRGMTELGKRGLTYDTWQYHHQLPALIALARAIPDTTIILDHLSTPLGVGGYEGKRDAIFARWKDDMAELAQCPNMHLKLGGFAMPDNGWGYLAQDTPPNSDQMLKDQGPWYTHALDLFGADRCMFESNFPVDRASVSYPVLWNFFKKLVADRPEEEKNLLFSDTARRVYRLPTP